MSKILLAEINIAELHIGKRSARPANVIKDGLPTSELHRGR
ncbi:hypothetical protein BV898_09635, partial [Hypsibius exemplaris]